MPRVLQAASPQSLSLRDYLIWHERKTVTGNDKACRLMLQKPLETGATHESQQAHLGVCVAHGWAALLPPWRGTFSTGFSPESVSQASRITI